MHKAFEEAEKIRKYLNLEWFRKSKPRHGKLATKKKGVYCLMFEDNTYFIGKTDRWLSIRVKEHLDRKSTWCRPQGTPAPASAMKATCICYFALEGKEALKARCKSP